MIQIVGIGLTAAVLYMIVREKKPAFAFLLTLFVGISVLLFLLGQIGGVLHMLEQLADKANVDSVFFKTVLKIIGIAYIAEFGAQIVRDAGLESVAAKIELSGKILILAMAIPIVTVIIESVMNLLPA